MLIKLIKYKDLDGNPKEGAFYFNITTSQFAEFETKYEGGSLSAMIRKISDGQAALGEIVDFYTNVIKVSHGVRSDDGERHIKTDELFEKFKQTDAYEVLYEELMDPAALNEFLEKVIPVEAMDRIKSRAERRIEEAGKRTIDQFPDDELMAMSNEDFNKLLPPKADRDARTSNIIGRRRARATTA